MSYLWQGWIIVGFMAHLSFLHLAVSTPAQFVVSIICYELAAVLSWGRASNEGPHEGS